MFVIRSGKTGRTFFRRVPNDLGYSHDWVMFREESPEVFLTSEHAHQCAYAHMLYAYDVIPLSEVPLANSESEIS